MVPGSPKSSTLSKLSATARGEPISESDADETANSDGEFDEAMIPENLRDPAFDRYIDLALLCKAWNEKDASALADVALQVREGERILLRPYRGFSSQQLLQEACADRGGDQEQSSLATPRQNRRSHRQQ